VLADFHFVAEPNSTAIIITRAFAAPRALVFDAWTKSEHVSKWWDPTGAPLAVCDIDFRIGGSFRWVNSGPDGSGHPFTGTYTKIEAPRRLSFKAQTLGGPESIGTLVFSETESGTLLTMTIDCASIEERNWFLEMRVDAGTEQTLANLAAFLEKP